jgi:hypothetical protein
MARVFSRVLAGFVFLALVGCGQQKPDPAALPMACAANMRMLDHTKQNWAKKMGKTDKDIPTMDDLAPYFRAEPPKCPTGGTYTLGAVGEPVQCSVAAHNEYYKEHPTPDQ